MMLRQWSRRSLTRLQQRPAVLVGGSKSSKERIAIVGGRSLRSVSTIVNSPWIHNHHDAHKKNGGVVIANNASRSLSSAVEEEYQPQPRPFKKLMAGKSSSYKKDTAVLYFIYLFIH
jgi:hypothetical protein